MNQRIDNAMIKILTQVMLIVLIVLFLTQIVSMNVIIMYSLGLDECWFEYGLSQKQAGTLLLCGKVLMH